ncbi:MAG: sortase [Chloroflexota bacterium]|nr:sortase [Chloroflexota bacterium]MBI5702149.1 sortase [Chloroflexota bacterium]
MWGNSLASAATDERPSAASAPAVSLNVPAGAFIGNNVNFTVTFDNPDPTDPGYGPLIDLIIPRNGADGNQNTSTMDGLTFVSATYLGVAVENTILTFPGSGGVTCVNHPYMVNNTGNPVQVCGNAGDTFVALRLPFGSFTSDQPPVNVDVTVSMSNLADLGTPLTIQARGGYQFGYTPLNDWCCGDDPSLTLSAWTSASVTPTLFTLQKTYNGPEDETATGPNFPRQYTVTAAIAPGQTMTSFNLSDILPNNMQFVSLVSTNPGGASCTLPSTTTPGGTLSCNFASVSGTVTMTFEYYIPLRDSSSASVIDPASGDDVTSCNNASGGGTWAPIDTRDTGGTFTQNPTGCEHTLTDKSIAIQKSVSVVGGGDPAPGKYLEYTLNFQISDFFAFNGVVITDVISDGQHFAPGFTPTLQINGNTYTLSAAGFNAANYDVACHYTGAGAECESNTPPINGTTTLIFRVSDEIITRGQDGRLIGGCVPTGGVAGDPSCTGYNDGPTTGSIVFRTLIQQNFTDTFPSGDSSVDQGDTLANTVSIEGLVLSTTDVSTVTDREADTSSASVTIGRGVLTKTIYAVNGSTSFGTPVEVKPGDRVTYRLTYTLTTGDVEDLALDDYLPLPVFHVGDPDENGTAGPAWTFNPTVNAVAPPAGVAKFGPSDTFYNYSLIVPTITSDITNNRLNFFYGDFDGPTEQPYTVDILFTVTVSDDPFADRLYLTNQARAYEGSTNGAPADANAIVQLVLTEPVLTTTKSAVASDRPGAVFTPALPVTFTAPGSAGPRWSGTINSNLLASTPINSDISGVDAGDLVTFAIFLENSGSSINGAFDIVIQDVFDALAFEYPTIGDPNSINLQVYYGSGTGPISYTKPDNTAATPADLFGGGIKLVDPVGQGVCQVHDPNSGNNVIVITYDLRLKSNIAPGTYTNTGSLTNYSGSEGGPNFLPAPQSEDATVTTVAPAIAKTLISTEINDTSNGSTQAVIGEIATYTVTLTIPEGVTSNAQLVDTLDAGLAFVALDSATLSPSLSITGSTTPSVAAGGQAVTFNFGDITNSDNDNTTAETITLTYRVVALNVAGNQSGTLLNNAARFTWNGGSASASAANLTVIEPTVNTAKSVLPTTADAGDTVTFTVTLSNPASGSTTAYDVTWSDVIPTGLSYVSGSASGSCGATPLLISYDSGTSTLSTSVSQLNPGGTCSITFNATVGYSVSPGQTITNTAQTQWTSLPGAVADRSTYNTDSDERNGTGGLLGTGVLNDYRTQGQTSVTINSIAPQKFLAATSEAHTGIPSGATIPRVAIGEIVRYRLVVQLPEGASPNFQIQDQLPAGLTYLDDGTARLALLSNGAPIASTEPTGSTLALALGSGSFGSGPWVNGGDPTVVTPTYALPDQNVGSSNSLTSDLDSYGSGTDPYFKLGTLTNNDSDADAEYVIIEFNALVDNTAAGSNDAGDARNNTFSVFINSVQNGATSNQIQVVVAEPLLTFAKAVATAPVDAGDTIAYTLTISAASGINRSTAFDLSVTDSFNSYLTSLAVTNVTTTQGATCTGNGGGTTPFSHNGGSFTGNTLTFTASCLDPGQSITVTVSGTVAASAPVGYTIPNTANLTYTSLPGTNGTIGNPTGSNNTGTPGSTTGERDGSGTPAQNDYTASGSANTLLAVPQIDKLNPVPTQYAIGQQVTFNLLITLPEGVTPALQVVDNLPLGLEYVSHQIITTAAASGGILAADYNGTLPAPTVTAPGGSGGDLTLVFGDTTTAADNVTNNNAFLVQVVAVVVNESGNQNGTTLTNAATVTWTGGSASDSVNVTVIEPELNIAKAVDDTTPAYGQTLTYTLTVSHLPTSTASAYDVVVTDTLPSGLTYVSGSISAPAGWTTNDTAAPTLTWTCAAPCSLSVGNTASLTYQVTVNGPPGPPNPGDTLTNTASMTWTSTNGTNAKERTGSGGINDYNDSASQTVTLTYPDLTITKTDGQTSYVPGSPLTYTIVVSNIGNGDAIGATVSDNIPPQITSWNWTCTTSGGATCNGSGGPITTDFTDTVNLPAGSSITYTVTAQTAPAATTDLTNTATVTPPAGITDPTPGNNSASDTDTANPQADLSATKDDGVTQYIPGSTLTYTIVVSNAGPSDAPGSLVSDAVPSQVTSWTWACTAQTGGASGCDPYSGSANFSDTVNLPAGSSITYTVTAQVASSATGNLTNTVTVTSPAGVTDSTPGNNTASDTDTQNSQAAISVTKDDGVTEYIPGSTLTYTITVTNTGPSDALGVSVTDNIPPQFTSWTWTCVSSGGATCNGSGGPITTDFSDTVNMPAGSSITYTVTAQVASSATGSLTNTVTISHPADSTPGDNTASDTDTPNFQADLYVTKTDGSTTYTPGVGVTYTVVIGNNGPSDVSGAILTDNIPSQATSWTWTCAGTTGGATGCDPYGPGNVNFSDTVDLPANSSITYTVTVVIPSSATGDLVNTANIEPPAGVTDTNSGNNTASDTDTQNSQAAISVTKDDGVTEYVPGNTLTYTIIVTNAGPSDALGVSVTDNIPPQFTSWTWTCVPSGGATCSGSGGPITTNFSDTVNMPAGSSITYTVTTQVASSATGSLTNTVTISHPADSTPADNTASDTDTPNPQADLSVTKDDGVTVVSPDSTITYTIVVSNAGPSDALGAVVSDLKPSQFDTWDWACTTQTGGASGCDPVTGSTTDFSDTVNLPSGASITYTVTAHIAASAASGSLTNTVTITLPTGVDDPTPANNSDDDTDIVVTNPSGDLIKSLIATNQPFTTDPSAAIGEILTYELVFTIPAGGTLPNLTLTDVLDRGLAFVGCLSVTPSSADITTTLAGGFAAACGDPTNPTVQTEPSGSTNPADPGRRVTFTLGDVSNSGTADGIVTIRYTAVVLDVIENQDGISLNNSAALTWSSGSLAASASDVTIVEPDFELNKTADRAVALPGSTITFTLTLRHTAQSNVDAFDVVLTDVLPAGLTYVPGSLTIISGPAGGVTDDTAAPTLRVTWANFPLLTGSSRSEAVVQFQATLGNLSPGREVQNTASLAWTSLPGDFSAPQSPYNNTSTERYYDPPSAVNIYGVQANVTITVPRLPATGFAPGVVTDIPPQPADKAYTALGDFWLEIPKLGVKMPIVGIPAKGEEWDLTWLWNQAGWLEGTAYPTHAGNSALTAHVSLPNGQPGPFVNLGNLRYGDQIIVHLGGQRYIYEVRQVRQVSPYSLSPLQHEEYSWLTLITCREYDAASRQYRYRLAVRAVLVKIVDE